MSHNRHRLVGLTGTNGAGKGEVAAYFVRLGYACHSLSDVIREKLKEDGLGPSRDHLIAKGNELRRRGGPEILARMVMEKVWGETVIDSIRNPGEVAYLRRQPGFFLLGIDAPAALRFERLVRRGRDESAGTLDEFIRKEAEEDGGDPEAQQLRACLAMADVLIINDGSRADLHRRLEEIL